MHPDHMNRREFVGLTTAGIAGSILGLGAAPGADAAAQEWDPNRPPVCTGKPLVIQPILMYAVAQRREATSWKSWGGVQNDEAAVQEARNIARELDALAGRADFPMKLLPVVKVKSTAEVARVHDGAYDVVVLYAATGSGDLLRACFPPQKDRDTIIFVRESSGPAYYWYEALSTKYLGTGRPAIPASTTAVPTSMTWSSTTAPNCSGACGAFTR